ncbi:MAG TPA: FGGY family carbohydrate kinase [Thermoproteota archaeon]|nr:FGGY family carbohydrate kinase [Thermoproteota archaeon]
MDDPDLLAAIDAGTTGVRTVIFNTKGDVVAWKYLEFPSYFPEPAWVEQDADDWWDRACRTSRISLDEAASRGVTPDRIAGISVTNQRETIVPVDGRVQAVHHALVWQDRRTVPQCQRIRESIDESSIYNVTGLTVDPYFSAPKILWIMENHPEVYARTHKFLLVHDYLIAKLTGSFVTSWDNASRTLLFDIVKFDWSDDILKNLKIDGEKLPQPLPSGRPVGEITSQAAREIGFAEGTPVVCGGGDQQCSAVGVGVVKPGRTKATTGTGTFVISFLEKPTFDTRRRVLCSCHSVPGKWVQEASMFSTGTIYRWFRDQFGQSEKAAAESAGVDPYTILNEEASESPPGSNGVLIIPHFVGAGAPYWDPYARGVIFGLALGHKKSDLIRAIMEGVAMEIRKNIEVMKGLGTPMKEIRVTGGMTRNPNFNQIQADVFGLPVLRCRIEESTSLGCAILAGVGVGVFSNVPDAADRMVQVVERYEPNPKNRRIYDKMFGTNLKIHEALSDAGVYKDLANLGADE